MNTGNNAASSVLLNPFDLRGLPLKNRVAMSPLTRSRAGKERLANSLMAEYYAQRASAGLIITEATVISKQGIGWLNSPGIYTDEQAAAWRQVVDAVHAEKPRSFSSSGTADGLPTPAFTRRRDCRSPLRPSGSKGTTYTPPWASCPMKRRVPWKRRKFRSLWRTTVAPPNGR